MLSMDTLGLLILARSQTAKGRPAKNELNEHAETPPVTRWLTGVI